VFFHVTSIDLYVVLLHFRNARTITAKYRIRIDASMKGDKASPKYAKKLGLGKTRISPKK